MNAAGLTNIQVGDDPTPRQREVHEAMLEFQRVNSIPPTLRELGALLGIVSTNAVKDHLIALEKRGLVRQHRPGSSRGWIAIQPTNTPEEGT